MLASFAKTSGEKQYSARQCAQRKSKHMMHTKIPIGDFVVSEAKTFLKLSELNFIPSDSVLKLARPRDEHRDIMAKDNV
jgi:hypothetical protein